MFNNGFKFEAVVVVITEQLYYSRYSRQENLTYDFMCSCFRR